MYLVFKYKKVFRPSSGRKQVEVVQNHLLKGVFTSTLRLDTRECVQGL